MRIDDGNVDFSLWSDGMPPEVEAFQADLVAHLTDQLRLTILRLKDDWYALPAYPETVSAWQIYESAVLKHDVHTIAELDAYLAARALPTREG